MALRYYVEAVAALLRVEAARRPDPVVVARRVLAALGETIELRERDTVHK